jgi:hypothetical protein
MATLYLNAEYVYKKVVEKYHLVTVREQWGIYINNVLKIGYKNQ